VPTFKVYATNQPDTELTVDDAELVDLFRQGLVVLGKGDISDKGRLKRTVAGDASPETVQAVAATFPTDSTTV
jgi:hypothetical protein